MSKHDELRRLREDLRKCELEAARLKLGIATDYLSHAIEHVEYVQSITPHTPVLRAVAGSKSER
ncbi:hypothetical protein NAP1_04675 [Erythrobacter sp. NAP1]|uniref:hypothetical protein n=1 Tax=Erythrobacter sp. NAP1 TaxID=237727 RepID=UPI0000686C68|nr:hypothetical protein [Erythrobacter sp. NAP1]EAQ30041.1 hypothetical protein NAP1_04675 [Erythrobacter sp. NAP1]